MMDDGQGVLRASNRGDPDTMATPKFNAKRMETARYYEPGWTTAR